MKITIIIGVIAAAILIAGCGKNTTSSGDPATPSEAHEESRIVTQSWGLTHQQLAQIREVAENSEDIQKLTSQLATAQRDAVEAALSTNASEATIRLLVEAVAKIQTEIALQRYTRGVKPVLATVTDQQIAELERSPTAAYEELFEMRTFLSPQPLGGIFVPNAPNGQPVRVPKMMPPNTLPAFAGGTMQPLDKDIPLAEGIQLANKSFPDIQPLTEEEVVAAVKAIKLMHPDIKQDVYETYMRIVKERVLPKGMYFAHTTAWNTGNGQIKVDWLDLCLQGHVATAEEAKGIPSPLPGFHGSGEIRVGGFCYRIRSRFVSSD